MNTRSPLTLQTDNMAYRIDFITDLVFIIPAFGIIYSLLTWNCWIVLAMLFIACVNFLVKKYSIHKIEGPIKVQLSCDHNGLPAGTLLIVHDEQGVLILAKHKPIYTIIPSES